MKIKTESVALRQFFGKTCLLKSFYVAFFKKRPQIQRAERWSLSAESEITLIVQSATKG